MKIMSFVPLAGRKPHWESGRISSDGEELVGECTGDYLPRGGQKRAATVVLEVCPVPLFKDGDNQSISEILWYYLFLPDFQYQGMDVMQEICSILL